MSVSISLYRSVFGAWLAPMRTARRARQAGNAALAAVKLDEAAQARNFIKGGVFSARARFGMPSVSTIEARLVADRGLMHAVRGN